MNEWTCAEAARRGDTEALRWLVDVAGCPWNSNVCVFAAGHGHLETLRFARERGCPWNEGVCFAAVGNFQWEVFRFLREHGCPGAEYYDSDGSRL